jgi:hypothetical protein
LTACASTVLIDPTLELNRIALDELEPQTRKRPHLNCIEPIMKALEVRVTLGEIMGAVRRAIDFKKPGM